VQAVLERRQVASLVERQAPPRRREIWPRLAVGVAVLVGLALRWQYFTREEVIGTDGAWYATLGYNLLHGRGYTDIAGATSTFYPPLYPISVGLVSLVVPNLELAGRLAALVANLALIPLTYLLARQAFERRVAFVAALLIALLPALAQNGVLVLSESLYTLCLCGATLAGIATLRASDRRRWRWAALTGMGLALAALTRTEGYPYIAIWTALLLAAYWPRHRRDWRRCGGVLAAFGAVYLLVLAPYLLFLHAHTGHWDLSGKVATNVVIAYDGMPAEEHNYFGLNAAGTTIGGYAGDRDSLLAELEQSPVAFIKHYRQALLDELNLLPQTISPLLFLLAPIGLIFVRWPRDQRAARVALLALLTQLVLLPLFFLDQRFLLPMTPALLIFAAAGMIALAERLSRAMSVTRWRLPVTAWVAVLLAGWVAWFLPVLLIGPFGNYDPWNQAIESRDAGEWLRAHYPPGQVVMSRKPYVPFYANGRLVELPQDNLDRILAYGRQHGARFLVVDERGIADVRPNLLPLLDGPAPPGLKLVYDWHGRMDERLRIFEITSG
jgi:4-amino-4-deoxy-L-arabinose transferase-like glycosyltransferase